jgi:hypothetical protein
MRIVSASIRVGPPRALARLGGSLEHCLHVVAVHLHAVEPVGGRALDRIDHELAFVGCGVCVLVVLQHEHKRQLAHAGHVHGLVPLAVGGRAVPEPGHGYPLLATHLKRQRQSAGHEGHVGQHRDHPDAAQVLIAEMHVAVTTAREAARAAHHLGQHASGPHAAQQMRAEVPVQDAGAVARGQCEGRSHRHRFLSASVVEAAGDLALTVKVERPLLGGSHEEHVAHQLAAVVHRQPGLVGQVLMRVDRRGSRGRRRHLFSLRGRIGVSDRPWFELRTRRGLRHERGYVGVRVPTNHV